MLLRFHDLLHRTTPSEILDIIQLKNWQVAAPRLRRGRRHRHSGPLLRPQRRGPPAGAAAPRRPAAPDPHDRAPSPTWRDRHHRPLELPPVAQHRRRHTGTSRRQRRGPQTRCPDALQRPVGRRLSWPRPACRAACCRSSPVAAPSLATPLIDGSDFLMFTGSTATGKIVAAQAGAQLKDCSMELGGKNPLLVLPGARLRASTVRGAVRGTDANSGQLCIQHRTPRRALRPLRRLRCRRLALRSGGRRASAPSSTSAPTWVRWPALDQLEEGPAPTSPKPSVKGAELLAGGRARPDLGPYFYEPTLLAGVTEDMGLCREETFGPVAAVYRCRLGRRDGGARQRYALRPERQRLGGSVPGAGRAVAARLQAGTVNVNEAYAAAGGSADAPMGGFKESGMGRRTCPGHPQVHRSPRRSPR